MELLEDGRAAPFEYRESRHRNGIPEGPRRHLLKRLEDIFNYLEALGMVHGTLWAADITLNRGEEEKVVLTDFDCTEKQGN